MYNIQQTKIYYKYMNYFHDVWLPQHPEFTIAKNGFCIEWYSFTDNQAPDYQCGVMFPLEG